MTITQSSEVAVLHRGALQAEHVAADPLTLFLANELFPMMIAYWPASANQLDSNATGTAKAWALTIKGFPVGLVREAVLQLADDAERQFAPRPAEVRAEILRRQPATATPTRAPRLEISIRACEMRATVTVLQRDGNVTSDAVQVELGLVMAEMRQRGFTITGRI